MTEEEENLVIENTSVGAVSKTKCAICYIKDIANLLQEGKDNLVKTIQEEINNI